jgi:hypothetical protein
MNAFKSLFLAAFLGIILFSCSSRADWRTASRESAGIAPNPAETDDAILQVYGADAWSWRGWFAIHTWISARRSNQDHYLVYDVVGWRSPLPVLGISRDIPDRHWYGARPRLLKEHRGTGVDALIDAVEAAVETYPWKKTYKAFPGPNSNTFTAWVAEQVPELELDLPVSAIGSGYIKQAD